MNLNSQATACWINTISTTRVAGGESRFFESLRDAVRFVMEDVVEPYRSTAFIDTDDGGRYSIEKIREIYASDEYKAGQG